MRGFTTVRDMGGPVFGLKRAIDEGAIIGPRIYPSGAMISQTSGHGDFRFPFELPRAIGRSVKPIRKSWAPQRLLIAPMRSASARTRAVEAWAQARSSSWRGGGVSSHYNPIESTQFTEAEIHAAVEAAENWGTYVSRARIHAACNPASRCGGRQVHRTWSSHRRSPRQNCWRKRASGGACSL